MAWLPMPLAVVILTLLVAHSGCRHWFVGVGGLSVMGEAGCCVPS